MATAATIAPAQDDSSSAAHLARARFKRGDELLRAFIPLSRAARSSVIKLDVNGNTVALGAVVDADGLAITKASEIKPGKLTCWLAGGKEVPAELLGVDEENDVALVKVSAKGLKPVIWATDELAVGQWVVTPGISEMPQAVGIVSVPPRKILHPKALIGVQLDRKSPGAQIEKVTPGLGAEAAGLKAGDRIVSVNDLPVKESDELIKTLRNYRDGQSVTLRVQREEREFDATVKLKAPSPSGQGHGLDREERMNRMGSQPSERAQGFDLAIQHDTVLQNWQCGGPLLNLNGKVIGLNIARVDRVASYALPSDVVRQSIRRLQGKVGPRPRAAETSTAILQREATGGVR